LPHRRNCDSRPVRRACGRFAWKTSCDPLQDHIAQQKEDGHALRYLVVGTKGAASTDVFFRRIKRWEFGDSPKCMTSKWVEDLTWDPKDDGEYYHNCRGQNIDIIRQVAAGRPPRHPARDAYETMRLVEAAEKSADTLGLVNLAAEPGTRHGTQGT
jgi:predicted dehydrogenase